MTSGRERTSQSRIARVNFLGDIMKASLVKPFSEIAQYYSKCMDENGNAIKNLNLAGNNLNIGIMSLNRINYYLRFSIFRKGKLKNCCGNVFISLMKFLLSIPLAELVFINTLVNSLVL